MTETLTLLVGAIVIACCGTAAAAAFTAHITDQDGQAVANAVLVLKPDGGTEMPAASTRLASGSLIDQRDEAFIPLVTIVPRGGGVRFANNDQKSHQVYSFSAIRQFEISLTHEETSPEIIFDTAGIAAIGCNIHDDMIAYVFVASSPWTLLTDDEGRAQIAALPAGSYQAEIWHPRLPPATPAPVSTLTVGNEPATLSSVVTLLPDRSLHRGHGGSY